MSLSLLQGYSSEEVDDRDSLLTGSDTDDADREEDASGRLSLSSATSLDLPEARLPSAADAFSMITGPPTFLNNCLAEQVSVAQSVGRRGRKHGSNRRSKEPPPAGVVFDVKADLVGFHGRVRNDVDSSEEHSSAQSTTGDAKQKHGVTLPGSKDASDLLRLCVQCGVPKTYTSERGTVCPICGDRPPNPEKEAERRRSTIKEKEKSKRMKGQSSHATWKNETEMQLRQQFD
ncbi:unnamed protein product [Victoria cruziana]